MEVIDMPISTLLGSNPIMSVDKLNVHIKEVADYSFFGTLCAMHELPTLILYFLTEEANF